MHVKLKRKYVFYMLIDSVDQKIVAILQLNARTSNAEIGRQVGLTASAVHERIKKLEKAGIIAGYQAILDHAALGKSLLAYVFVRIHPHRMCTSVAAALERVPSVQEVAHLTGDECFMVKTRCADTAELESLIFDINEIEGVHGTRTVIAFSAITERASLAINEMRGDGKDAGK